MFIHVFIVSILYLFSLQYSAVLQYSVNRWQEQSGESSSKVLLCRGSGHNWGLQRLLCCTMHCTLYITVYSVHTQSYSYSWAFTARITILNIVARQKGSIDFYLMCEFDVWCLYGEFDRGHQMHPEPARGWGANNSPSWVWGNSLGVLLRCR